MPDKTRFEMPPKTTASSGTERRVGFEFEYSGVGLRKSAEIVAGLTGGLIEKNHRFSYKVEGGKFGTFQIESDSSMLAQKRWEPRLRELGFIDRPLLRDKIESWLEAVSDELVPFEIVTPPIGLSEIEFAENLRIALLEAGAKGTHHRFFSAYGFQFNPEVPDFKVETLLSILRAFFLLYDRLNESEDVPVARRLLPYIDPFPESYVSKVLDLRYSPTLKGFMRDYLSASPTRNRPLDLLPLFRYLDEGLTFSYGVEKHLVKARPTFHYRLPSSLVDEVDWSIATEWNKWVEIENLAANPKLIRRMSAEWQDLHSGFVFRSHSRWAKRSEELLHEYH
jgi:hypothetical protein